MECFCGSANHKSMRCAAVSAGPLPDRVFRGARSTSRSSAPTGNLNSGKLIIDLTDIVSRRFFKKAWIQIGHRCFRRHLDLGLPPLQECLGAAFCSQSRCASGPDVSLPATRCRQVVATGAQWRPLMDVAGRGTLGVQVADRRISLPRH